MGKAAENEADFRKRMAGQLKGKKRYSRKIEGETIEISVDFHFEHKGKLYLVEIDSANEAKLLVGQYCLLNKLFDEDSYEKSDVVFVVVHYYKNYAPERTLKNLGFVKGLFEDPITYQAFHQEKICDWNDFLNKINSPNSL